MVGKFPDIRMRVGWWIGKKKKKKTNIHSSSSGTDNSNLDIMEHSCAGVPSCHPPEPREIGKCRQTEVVLRMVPASLMDHGG